MHHTQQPKKWMAGFAAMSLAFGFIGGALSDTLLQQPNSEGGSEIVQPVTTTLVEEKSQVIEAIEKVSPSVVSIIISQEQQIVQNPQNPFFFFGPQGNNSPFHNFFPQQPQPQPEGNGQNENDEPIKQKVGGGSGFFFNEEGLILTNRHVVSNENAEFTIRMDDGTEFPAEVVSRDFFNDIAVMKIVPEEGQELPDFTPVTFGNSSDLKIGQGVIAIGNALAEFENSATKGIISANGRQILASDGMGRGQNLSGLLQTDAAINPGNSGGPLINLEGEVVGVNTAIAQGANGIGFAIPIDDVKPVVDSVMEHGRIVRPILGVMFTMLTPELAEELELEIEEGALLRGDGENFAVLPDKPAEKAGLLEKDVIVEVNGNAINEDNPLQREVMKYAPGDKIKVKYLRKGVEKTVEVTLEEANADGEGEETEE